ncbi:hypothetical protein MJO28_009568 [Puccinia striiformis f. sp. tritici]|uniref:Uncharacterized protein n=1 Tax=Puccinia striiformis f. sp. tritici TaxID=168172 RepID=A0ACC0E9L5_9BASI|nr:hypothetical protein MJO28_009568 [Puccinia striiformis f. sp. tritici]KAI7950679.1 hypothetical protein MJO29_009353 [Puccinia striiformis f. sp. tritici]
MHLFPQLIYRSVTAQSHSKLQFPQSVLDQRPIMIFPVLVPLILFIGKCTIAPDVVRWIPASEHPSPSINHSEEVARSSLAAINGNEPISNEQIAASSLLPVAGADSGRLIGQQGVEHCIPITSEGTPAPGRIQSSQDNSVTRLDYPSEMGHRIGIPNQGSRSARLEQGPEDVMMGCIGEWGLRIDNVNGIPIS